MRVVAKRLHQRLDIFVDEGVVRDVASPGSQLLLVRRLAKKNQVRDFQKVASLRELFDRVATVFQDPLVAVNEGDRAFGGRGVHQRGIVRHQAEIIRIRFDLAQVHRADRPVINGERVRFGRAIVCDR